MLLPVTLIILLRADDAVVGGTHPINDESFSAHPILLAGRPYGKSRTQRTEGCGNVQVG